MFTYSQPFSRRLSLFLCSCFLWAACSEAPETSKRTEPIAIDDNSSQKALRNNPLPDTSNHDVRISSDTQDRSNNKNAEIFTLEGKWRLNDIVYLYHDTSGLSQDKLLNKESYLSIINNEFAFLYQGTPRSRNIHCTLDSIRRVIRIDYGPKDINDHLKGTSYWYGYRQDRGDSILSFAFHCPDGQYNFEYFNKDTLGYFDNRRLFLFARQP